MKYKNSFFKIDVDDKGSYLILYPAINGGKSLDIREVIDYLEKYLKIDYSMAAIKTAFEKLGEEAIKVKISDDVADDLNEIANIEITRDRMIAYIRFYPPVGNGKRMSKKEIFAELERLKITHGIVDKVVEICMVAPQYCLSIPIAKGKPPVPAVDTKIEYKFNTRPLAKPKVLEDGSVDFHELSLFSGVHKGDLLAVLTPHSLGEPGYNIYGTPIPQNKPKVKKLKFGRNIKLSEDECSITSEVDGNVTFADGTVFVSDTYNVPADVDTSTGDIEYEGNVIIAGNVRTGFSVKAKGDIEVNGVVEGAELVAGGNIVIKRGCQGMGKGNMKAGGDICAQFFESANVYAGGDVNAGSILHSTIKADGKVIVSGRKGFIVGGEVICNGSVEVNSIGNKMDTVTTIKVGVRPELYDEMKSLISVITEQNQEIEETSSYLNVYKEKLKKGAKLTPENIKQIKVYNSRLEELQGEKNKNAERLRDVRIELDNGKKGFIKVLGNTHCGVSISIASQTYSVTEKKVRSLFKLEGGEITIGTL